MPNIILDAGHYGYYNHSPSVAEYWESKMSWKLHLLLKSELEKYGITVDTTRADQEKDLDVYYRGYMAKGYDMILSLHSNATGSGINENIDYPIVYRLNSDTSGLAGKLAETICSVIKTKQAGREGTRLQTDGNEYYGVLRGAAAAGCKRAYIVEHSFHTATAPSNWLLNDDNLLRMATEEAKVIAEYFGIKTKEDNEMTADEKRAFTELQNKVTELEKSQEKVYHYWNELPEWAAAPTKAMNEAGLFAGESASDLNISYSMLRMLVVQAASLKKQGVIKY